MRPCRALRSISSAGNPTSRIRLRRSWLMVLGDGDLDAQTGVGVVACGVCGIAHKIGRSGPAFSSSTSDSAKVLFRQSPSPAVAAFRSRLHVDHILGVRSSPASLRMCCLTTYEGRFLT